MIVFYHRIHQQASENTVGMVGQIERARTQLNPHKSFHSRPGAFGHIAPNETSRPAPAFAEIPKPYPIPPFAVRGRREADIYDSHEACRFPGPRSSRARKGLLPD